MKSWQVRGWLFLAAVLALAYAGWTAYRLKQVWAAEGSSSADISIAIKQSADKKTDDDRHVDEFALTDQEGQPFGTEQLHGRVWVASFFFTACPATCRQLNQSLANIAPQLPDDARMVSVTCDPETDTPEVLKKYGELFHADPTRWKFLTGQMKNLSRVGQDIFQVALQKGVHSERAFVVDRDGYIRGRFSILQPEEAKKLVELVKELSEKPASVPADSSQSG